MWETIVMHMLAQVFEILVKILQNTPFCGNLVQNTSRPQPPEMKT